MSDPSEFVILYYSDKKQKFQLSSHQKEILKLLRNQDIKKLEQELTVMDYDGVLVHDKLNKRWYLIFASNTGIVKQRRMRRQAESIARTGFNDLENNVRIAPNLPLIESSETEIGDLWKSVQMKYVISDLKGAPVEPPKPQDNPDKKEDLLDSVPPTPEE